MSTIAHYNAQGQEIASAYAATSDQAARKGLRAAAVKFLRPLVASHVRRAFGPKHAAEALQAGLLGVIVALDRYAGSGTAQTFSAYAFTAARDEIRSWADRAVYWRKSAKNKHRVQGDRTIESSDSSAFLTRPCDAPSPEEEVSEAELSTRLRAFLDTCTPEEKDLLLSEDHRRGQSRRRLVLIGRARAFMGADDDGPGSVVSGGQGSGRPDGQPSV